MELLQQMQVRLRSASSVVQYQESLFCGTGYRVSLGVLGSEAASKGRMFLAHAAPAVILMVLVNSSMRSRRRRRFFKRPLL